MSNITLKKASANAVLARLSKAGRLQNGGVLAMYAAQLAHAGEPAAVRNLLLRLVGSSFAPSGAGLTNDWRGSGWTKQGAPDLDIGVNIGFATAITECIVQSCPNAIKILPAIFPELGTGRISDVATDFAARVSMEWDIGRGKCRVEIMPKRDCKIDVFLPPELRGTKNKLVNAEKTKVEGLSLAAGKLTVLEF